MCTPGYAGATLGVVKNIAKYLKRK